MLDNLGLPLLTTWSVFTEAMYFAGAEGDYPMQRLIAELVENGTLRIHVQTTEDFAAMDVLMRRYADTPMDLADVSLMVAAEALGAPRIFSLDSDFYIYRTAAGGVLEVLPGPIRA